MSDRSSMETTWPASRLPLFILFVFVIQIVVLFYTSRSVQFPEPYVASSFRLLISRDQPESLSALESLIYEEPGFLITASPNGFSANTWETRMEVNVPEPQWTEPELWLNRRTEELTQGFRSYVDILQSQPSLVASKPSPRLFDVPDVSVSDSLEGFVRLHGTQLDVHLTDPLALPMIQQLEPLPPTWVEVGVNALGQVISCRVIQSSGNANADTAALKAVPRLRFQVLRIDSPDAIFWGQLEFHWQTQSTQVIPPDAAALP